MRCSLETKYRGRSRTLCAPSTATSWCVSAATGNQSPTSLRETTRAEVIHQCHHHHHHHHHRVAAWCNMAELVTTKRLKRKQNKFQKTALSCYAGTLWCIKFVLCNMHKLLQDLSQSARNLTLRFNTRLPTLETHSVSPITTAGDLILIYDFLLSRPRVVQYHHSTSLLVSCVR